MARVLLFCFDTIGVSMAGPAIRYWEMAKALSRFHDVTVLTQQPSGDVRPEGFKLISKQEIKSAHGMYDTDVIITQCITHRMAWHAKRYGARLILDAYDPMPLENLEVYKHQSPSWRSFKHESICRQFNFAFCMADAVICANQRQRDLWMGQLLALGKITAAGYDKDPSLSSLLGIVPFGLSSTPPRRTGPGLRARHNLPEDAKILLWGGGIWNWFDPLTLIDALAQISAVRSDIHLCFLGVKHPNEAIPEMEMCAAAISKARDLGLLGKYVHVHYGWTPYDERQNCLLEATIGVSTHFDNLETHYSFRTRILDYLWAGMPIIATQGDAFADIITGRKLGMTVPFKDSLALAEAITTLLDDPVLYSEMSANIKALSSSYQWEVVTEPLVAIIEQLLPYRPQVNFKILSQLVSAVFESRSPRRIMQYAWAKFAPQRLFSSAK